MMWLATSGCGMALKVGLRRTDIWDRPWLGRVR